MGLEIDIHENVQKFLKEKTRNSRKHKYTVLENSKTFYCFIKPPPKTVKKERDSTALH